MATDELVQALKETFGAEPDVVSFSGKTEVVDGARRVYLTPEMDTFISFPEGDPNVVRSVDDTLDKVWVRRDQRVVLSVRRSRVNAGWLEGGIGDLRLSAEVLAVDIGRVLWGEDVGLCLSKSTKTPRCTPLFRLDPGDPGPRAGRWSR